MVHLYADSLGRLLRVDLGEAGEWAEKGQGTLHPLYPRGSTVVSSGRRARWCCEGAPWVNLVDIAHFQASVA